jgi:SAM-dependent methyltransferase
MAGKCEEDGHLLGNLSLEGEAGSYMEFDDYLKELETSKETCRVCGSSEGELAYMRQHAWRFRGLWRMMPRNGRPLHILEIGPTPFTLLLKKTFPHWDVWALDRCDRMKERFERGGVALRACDLDYARIPLSDNFFDFVICAEVLEHVFAPPSEVIKEIARTMRPAGRLLLTVPNLANLRNRLMFLFGHSPLADPNKVMKSDPLEGHGHVREYTRKEIVSVCRTAGLEVLRARMIWKSPADVLRLMVESSRGQLLRRGFYVGKLLHAFLNSLVPWFRGNIVVECRKPAGGDLLESVRRIELPDAYPPKAA